MKGLLGLPADSELHWLKIKRKHKGGGDVCIYGISSPFDYGTMGIPTVCSAWLKPPFVSVATDIWLQLRP